ncbi:MAG TPA: sugar phosphate isomerase/epimerase [Chitinophagaceae bacterium]|nr:sugar phosphate isomerase/epimerase [Chitinophagaceae bacterium]
MQSRKEFLKISATAALGGVIFPGSVNALFNKKSHAAGLQLYTLFNILDSDVQVNLSKVRAIGYKEIESAFSKKGGYYGMKPKEFASLLKDLGLSWKSHHVIGAPFKLPPGAKPPTGADGKPISFPPMKNLRDNYQEIIDDAAEGGFPYLVCANTPISTVEDVKQSIDTLNKASAAAKKAGIIMAYHNHDKEFDTLDGKVIYDRLLEETDPDTLKMELDLCWVTKAGVDPVSLFKKHPGRFPLWHVKDLDKEKKGPAPVGTGIVDFKRIFANAKVSGMKHFFVEHDNPADPFASITTSYNNLKKILK